MQQKSEKYIEEEMWKKLKKIKREARKGHWMSTNKKKRD